MLKLKHTTFLKATVLSSIFWATCVGTHVAQADSVFVFPLLGERVSSSFGPRKHPVRKVHRHHNGIDLAAPDGAQIRAIASGTVVFADPYKGYGKLVVVLHKNGITSHYGHCKEILAEPGAVVKAGEIIATVGSTGLATGPHLHFEIRCMKIPLDPLDFLPTGSDLQVIHTLKNWK